MTKEERKVILASSFEWYDFYLYGSLAAFIGAQFFTPFPEASRNIFALLALRRSFLVRLRRLGLRQLGRSRRAEIHLPDDDPDHGLSTFLVGILPGYQSWGIAAPICLIVLRMLQGLALGGEWRGGGLCGRTCARRAAQLLYVVDPGRPRRADFCCRSS